jgi:polyphosphate glucokinase
VLDEQGTPVRPPHKLAFVKTPSPAVPGCVFDALVALADQVESFDRISVGFPGTVHEGVVVQSSDLGTDWTGCAVSQFVEQRLHRPVRTGNATDLQGWGAIRGDGIEMIVTLGVHVRASLFLDGVLVPNVQLGNHRLNGRRLDLDGPSTWIRRVLKAAASLQKRFKYDHLYLGGPNAKQIRAAALPPNVTIVASLNGLLGGIALWQGHEMR